MLARGFGLMMMAGEGRAMEGCRGRETRGLVDDVLLPSFVSLQGRCVTAG
jgi:hypothetical protein